MNPTPKIEADKEPSTYMDAMHIILRHIHGAWPRADERIEMAKEIEALVDKAVVAELENAKSWALNAQSKAGCEKLFNDRLQALDKASNKELE